MRRKGFGKQLQRSVQPGVVAVAPSQQSGSKGPGGVCVKARPFQPSAALSCEGTRLPKP